MLSSDTLYCQKKNKELLPELDENQCLDKFVSYKVSEIIRFTFSDRDSGTRRTCCIWWGEAPVIGELDPKLKLIFLICQVLYQVAARIQSNSCTEDR